jgi:hypothetical protein
MTIDLRMNQNSTLFPISGRSPLFPAVLAALAWAVAQPELGGKLRADALRHRIVSHLPRWRAFKVADRSDGTSSCAPLWLVALLQCPSSRHRPQ